MPYWSEPGVFNVLDPWVYVSSVGYTGLVANSSGDAAQNTAVLQGIIELAQGYAAVGGSCPSEHFGAIILFPGHSVVPEPVNNEAGATDEGSVYFFESPNPDSNAPAIDIDCCWPLLFKGTGNVKLIMYAEDVSDNSGDMFSILTAGPDNTGGITFEDLTFAYSPTNQIPPTITWSAIHTIPSSPGADTGGAQNVRIVRCAFEDCPIGVWFEEALQTSILQCTFTWSSNVGIAIMLGDGANGKGSAKEVYIAACVITGAGDTTPPGQTAIQIGGADHVRVEDCQIDHVTNGIIITPGAGPGTPLDAGSYPPLNAVHLSFTGVNVYGSTTEGDMSPIGIGVLIQPATEYEHVAQVVFQGCTFEMGEYTTPTTSGPGILVDGQGASIVDSVRFVSCYSCRWPGPGIKIIGGATNCEILGGTYAGNSYPDTSDFWGIYLSDCTGVRIVGACCVGMFEYVTLQTQIESYQQAVGIYIDEGSKDVIVDSCDVTGNSQYGIVVNGSVGAVTNIFIRSCNATGYSGYNTAIYVDGTGSNVSTVQITNCAGYNDQGATLHSPSVVPPTGTFYNTTFSYYGPIVVYVWGNTATVTMTLQGIATGLKSGGFTLGPNMSAAIAYTMMPAPNVFILGM